MPPLPTVQPMTHENPSAPPHLPGNSGLSSSKWSRHQRHAASCCFFCFFSERDAQVPVCPKASACSVGQDSGQRPDVWRNRSGTYLPDAMTVFVLVDKTTDQLCACRTRWCLQAVSAARHDRGFFSLAAASLCFYTDPDALICALMVPQACQNDFSR